MAYAISESQWFRAGQRAFADGRELCPYLARTMQEAAVRRDWLAGYKAAKNAEYLARIRAGQD